MKEQHLKSRLGNWCLPPACQLQVFANVCPGFHAVLSRHGLDHIRVKLILWDRCCKHKIHRSGVYWWRSSVYCRSTSSTTTLSSVDARASGMTPCTPPSRRGLMYAQGPHVTYNRRTEKQTNAHHNVSLLRRSCFQLGYRPPNASWRPYILLPSFLFITQMWQRCVRVSVCLLFVRSCSLLSRLKVSAMFLRHFVP